MIRGAAQANSMNFFMKIQKNSFLENTWEFSPEKNRIWNLFSGKNFHEITKKIHPESFLEKSWKFSPEKWFQILVCNMVWLSGCIQAFFMEIELTGFRITLFSQNIHFQKVSSFTLFWVLENIQNIFLAFFCQIYNSWTQKWLNNLYNRFWKQDLVLSDFYQVWDILKTGVI